MSHPPKATPAAHRPPPRAPRRLFGPRRALRPTPWYAPRVPLLSMRRLRLGETCARRAETCTTYAIAASCALLSARVSSTCWRSCAADGGVQCCMGLRGARARDIAAFFRVRDPPPARGAPRVLRPPPSARGHRTRSASPAVFSGAPPARKYHHSVLLSARCTLGAPEQAAQDHVRARSALRLSDVRRSCMTRHLLRCTVHALYPPPPRAPRTRMHRFERTALRARVGYTAHVLHPPPPRRAPRRSRVTRHLLGCTAQLCVHCAPLLRTCIGTAPGGVRQLTRVIRVLEELRMAIAACSRSEPASPPHSARAVLALGGRRPQLRECGMLHTRRRCEVAHECASLRAYCRGLARPPGRGGCAHSASAAAACSTRAIAARVAADSRGSSTCWCVALRGAAWGAYARHDDDIGEAELALGAGADTLDDVQGMWLAECDFAALWLTDAAGVIPALVSSERVWQILMLFDLQIFPP
ncbi:hypothetical protein GGX14DRAFT_558804 [Mycena pura]|uniref:Uncharacterized protein n=1 Tax=Mycena pura TaxID=153505 RepID=A0AAD6YHZ2_9AGAR|nr:hypothetical protein GGX14DRAFT_558804 [Mycena pura]